MRYDKIRFTRYDKLCVIAATNSKTEDGKTVDYIRMARIAARRVKHYLGIPTFLITNSLMNVPLDDDFLGVLYGYTPTTLSTREVLAGSDIIKYTWINDMRIQAYERTYDLAKKILMIDADYMVSTNLLYHWLEIDSPFQIFDRAYDVSGRGINNEVRFPSKDIVQRWATAMCWEPGPKAEAIFETAKMVRENYAFYALMLGMPTSPFRNDVAFSVACHLHNVPESLPIPLYNVPVDTDIIKPRWAPEEEWILGTGTDIFAWKSDMHVMNKNYAINPMLMDRLRLHEPT